jgi:hypothetical protein
MLASEVYCTAKIVFAGKEGVVKVLEELSLTGKISRKSLVSLPTAFPTHQEFVKRIAELDAHGLSKVLKRLSFQAQPKLYLFWKNPFF